MQLTVIKYARLIGKTPMTVYRWVREGRLPDGVKVKNCCGVKKIVISKAYFNSLIVADEDY